MGNNRWLNWSEIAGVAKNRRVLCWGKGEWLTKALPYLPVAPEWIVDNNPYDHGTLFAGIPIDGPTRLASEDRDSVFVVITSTGFAAIGAQLQDMGFEPGRDFCVSPTLQDYQIITEIQEHDQTVFFSVSDPPQDAPAVGGGLYRYSLVDGQLTKLISGLTHGIVQGKDDTVFLVDDSVRGVRVLDGEWATIGVVELPTHSRPHGVGYCSTRDRLYVVLPGIDAIAVVEVQSGKVIDHIHLSGKSARAGTPQHHPNDVCAHGDSLYATMFSLSGNWKIGAFDGCVLEFDLDTHERSQPVVQGLWMPHTPTVIRGALHWADSMRGEVRSTSWKILAGFNGFVRGIAHDGRFYYVGQSQHRYVGRRLGVCHNISLDTGIYVVDEATKATRFHGFRGIVDINAVFVRG